MAELSVVAADHSEPRHGVSLDEALRVWLKVALLSFGGPAAQIAVITASWSTKNSGFRKIDFCTRSTIACCCRDRRRNSSLSISAG
jgi:hypothetical protein